MVRSGEAAGNLDAVLSRLADFLDAQHALRSKVSGALTYPIIMVVLGSVVMGVLMVVVVPKITPIFEDRARRSLEHAAADLPGRLVGSYWWAVILFFGGMFLLYRRWSRKPKGRALMDRIKLKLPLFGPLVRFVAIARFARTLATMLAAGVPVLNALEIVKKVLNNSLLEKVVEDARDAIREGESIAATLKTFGPVPAPHGAHGGGGRAFRPARGHAGERRRRLRARRRRQGQPSHHDLVAAADRRHGPGRVFIVFSVLQPILDMQNFVQ